MDYYRNRKRINQLSDIGLVQQASGFIKDGYFVTNHNVSYLSEEAWNILIKQLQENIGVKSDEELFLNYILQLNAVKAPELKDKRLSEMIAIIDNVIKEYTTYVDEELSEMKVPLCVQITGRTNKFNSNKS